MEKLRADRFNACATLVQKSVRRFIYRNRYVRMRELTLGLQRVARRKVAQAKMQLLRKQKAAIQIQARWRAYVARKQYLAKMQFILQLQTGKYWKSKYQFWASSSLLITLFSNSWTSSASFARPGKRKRGGYSYSKSCSWMVRK